MILGWSGSALFYSQGCNCVSRSHGVCPHFEVLDSRLAQLYKSCTKHCNSSDGIKSCRDLILMCISLVHFRSIRCSLLGV